MVHPHGCGDNSQHWRFVSRLSAVHPHGCGDNALLAAHLARPAAVHPHGCGDNGLFTSIVNLLLAVHPHGCGDNPNWSRRGAPAPPVHPHGCGDNVIPVSITGRISSGSPPRVWGQRSEPRRLRQTRLGSPPRVWGQLAREFDIEDGESVHPHGCGDNGFPPLTARQKTGGSPPRVWGQPFHCLERFPSSDPYLLVQDRLGALLPVENGRELK